jgi:hypothetical protein
MHAAEHGRRIGTLAARPTARARRDLGLMQP